MNLKTEENNLKYSIYPGRGIVIGMSPDKKSLIQVYWIMGRSPNSKNRIFEKDNLFVRTKAYDESKLLDPSLIIYYPCKVFNQYHIITNGDQTETIYEYLKNNKSFSNALETRCYEPDGPNFTPRISGVINADELTYKLSILKTINNNEKNEMKSLFQYSSFIKGIGHCITTYNDDGDPLPSFTGEPYTVPLYNSIKENASIFWEYLDDDNKVSLMVKMIDVKTKEQTIHIVNKNK